MAAPAFRSAGTIAHGTGAVTPAAPSGLATNDIEILVVESQAGTHSLSTAAGFAQAGTQIDVSSGTATIATSGSIWWRRWNGTDGDPTVAAATNHVIAQRYAFSGCITTGDPWDFIDQSSEATEDTTGSADASSSTSAAERLIAIIVGSSKPDTLGTAEISSPSNANLTSLTERADNAGNSGNGGHVGLFTGEKATAGAVGNTTYTKATSAYKWHFVVALKPAGASNQTVSVSGLGSAAAFGSVTVVPGGVNVAVTGLGSAAAFGTVTAVPGNRNVAVTGLGSAAAFGTVTAAPGNRTIAVAGLGSAAAFGGIEVDITVPVTGLGSAASFGSVTASTTGGAQNVPVTGLGSAAAFGAVTPAPGNRTIAVAGLGSAAAFGALAQIAQTIRPAGLGSAAQFGTVTVAVGNTNIAVPGRGSAAQFGSVNASTPGGGPSFSPAIHGGRHV